MLNSFSCFASSFFMKNSTILNLSSAAAAHIMACTSGGNFGKFGIYVEISGLNRLERGDRSILMTFQVYLNFQICLFYRTSRENINIL